MELSVEDFKQLLLDNYLLGKELAQLKSAVSAAAEKRGELDGDQD